MWGLQEPYRAITVAIETVFNTGFSHPKWKKSSIDLSGNFPLFPKSLRPLTQDLVCFGATGPTWHIVAVRQGRVVFCKDCTNFVSPHVKHTTIHTFLEVLLRKVLSADISGAGIGSSTFEDEEINNTTLLSMVGLPAFQFGRNMPKID